MTASETNRTVATALGNPHAPDDARVEAKALNVTVSGTAGSGNGTLTEDWDGRGFADSEVYAVATAVEGEAIVTVTGATKDNVTVQVNKSQTTDFVEAQVLAVGLDPGTQ